MAIENDEKRITGEKLLEKIKKMRQNRKNIDISDEVNIAKKIVIKKFKKLLETKKIEDLIKICGQ